MNEISKTEIGKKLEKLGIEKLVFLNRNQIEKLLARHFEKDFLHISTVFGDHRDGEISATLRPDDAPKFFFDHHPGGEKIDPGVNLVEVVNQSLAAFLLTGNPKFAFVSREISAKFKNAIEHHDEIRAEIKILEIKTRGKIATVVAEAKIFKNDSKKPAAIVKIKGAGGEKS